MGLGVGKGLGAREKLRARSMEKLFLGVRKNMGLGESRIAKGSRICGQVECARGEDGGG